MKLVIKKGINMRVYKIKKGFMLREVSGSYIVVPVGKASLEFKGLITLNHTSAFMWQLLLEGKTEAELVEALLNEYEVSYEVAKTDCENFIKKLVDGGLVE